MTPLDYALQEIGTLEDISSGSNPEVLKYFKKIGQSQIKDDSISWCAAFVGYCLEMAGVSSTKALNARSYLKWGKRALIPKLGDIVVLWRISPNSEFGHVGFFLRVQGSYIWMISGNTSDAVVVSRFPISQLLDYRAW